MRHLLITLLGLLLSSTFMVAQNNVQVTPDSIKFKEGENVKAYIRWDGTDLRIENDEIGDSDIVIDAENDLFLFTNDAFRMIIDKAGDVGIGGVVNPEHKLEVQGDGLYRFNSNGTNPTLELNETEGNDFSRLRMNNATDDAFWDIAGRTGTTPRFNFFYNNGTGGSNIMSIDGENKRVGIGISTPEAVLDVRGGNALFSDGIGIGDTDLPQADEGVRVEGKTDGLSLWNGSASTYISWYNVAGGVNASRRASLFYQPINGPKLQLQTYASGQDISLVSGGDILFRNGTGLSPSISMFLKNNGDLGLGTTNPDGKMEIFHNSVADNPHLYLYENEDDFARLFFANNQTTGAYFSLVGNPKASDPRFIIAYNDGTTSSASGKLIVTDTKTKVEGDLEYTGSLIGPSDIRLKKNIKNLDGASVLEQILQLQPKTYLFNTDKYSYISLAKGKQFGFISQEVEQIFPNLVHTDVHTYEVTKEKGEVTTEEVEIKGLDYISFVPLLTKAIQEQQTQIEDLKASNETLKATNEALMDRLARIEALLTDAPNESRTERIVVTDAKLAQNAPNPFSENTMISYSIPNNVKNALLQITDANGSILKTIEIESRGNGQVELQANTLSAGHYSYSLILDGKVLETKQMLLTK